MYDHPKKSVECSFFLGMKSVKCSFSKWYTLLYLTKSI